MTIIDRRGITVADAPSFSIAQPHAGLAIKMPVRVATTSSVALSGLQTVDGVALAEDDRVLVKDQANAVENGIYAAASGNWRRAVDLDGPAELVKGAMIRVTDGTVNGAKQTFVTSANPIAPGTSALTFSTPSSAGLTGPNASNAGSIPTFTSTDGSSVGDSGVHLSVEGAGSRSISLGGNISLGGGFATSGAHDLTAALTGTTNVTLPTAGILATLAGSESLTNKTIDAAMNTVNNLTTSMFAADVVDSDPTLSASSPTRIASQNAIKAYVDNLLAAQDAFVSKGVIDCSTNPNYPMADNGHTYRVSVAGRIGGASGPNVEAGDMLICTADGSASGNHTTIGANWARIQVDIDGAVTMTGSQTLTNKTLASAVINTPDINGGTADGLTSFGIRSTGAAFDMRIASAEALTATRSVSWNLGDADRSVSLAGNVSFAGAVSTSGAYALALTLAGATSIILPTAGTLATLGGTETLTNKTLTSPVINNAAGAFISSLSLATPNGAADYAVFFDATDNSLKKALLDDMPGGGGGGGGDPSLPFAVGFMGF